MYLRARMKCIWFALGIVILAKAALGFPAVHLLTKPPGLFAQPLLQVHKSVSQFTYEKLSEKSGGMCGYSVFRVTCKK